MTNREEILSDLSDAVEELPDTELEVILLQAQRLVKGLREYGPLDLNSRDWDEERLYEELDASNYSAFEILRRRRLRATMGDG